MCMSTKRRDGCPGVHLQIKAKTRFNPKMVQVELLTAHTPICPHAKIPILHGMGGASRQSGGAAVAASTEKLNTHSADIMRVDVLTAHTPFCPLAAWLRTLPKPSFSRARVV